MDKSLFEASTEELKRGFRQEGRLRVCLCCGFETEAGMIYPGGDRFYDAERYMELHIEEQHGGMLAYLLTLDKSATGLTGTHKRLLELTAQGMSDDRIRKEMGIGSPSTIRNHRFALREKERQARLFLAVMELLSDQGAKTPVTPSGTGAASPGSKAKRAAPDELDAFFPLGTDGPLARYPSRSKALQPVLDVIAEHFAYGQLYTEQEVNDVLEPVYADYALLRRSLVDYGYLERKTDGSEYWRLARRKEDDAVDRRKELQEQAKEIKIEAGVYGIRNLQNGKILVESTPNLKKLNGLKLSLDLGSHMNRQLQTDWTALGENSFAFEVLEKLKRPETGPFDEKRALKKLKEKWLRELMPFGEQGYNSDKERPEEQ